MELKLRDGDYVPDGIGGFVRTDGAEALLQRVLFRLKAHRGAFPFREDLGSRLSLLGQVPAADRLSAAKQYAVESLADEDGLCVTNVALAERNGAAEVTVDLDYEGTALSVTVTVQ